MGGLIPFGQGPVVRGHRGCPTPAHLQQANRGRKTICLRPLPAPELIQLLIVLNVPKGGFQHVSEFTTRLEAAYTAATALPFPRPIPSRDRFMDTWKELVKPLALVRPVSVADSPTSGRSWPLQLWARYIQSRPPLVDTINWKQPLTFLLRRDAYPCAGGSWTQLSVGLLNHGAQARAPAYLSLIGMAVCMDMFMAALATIWSQNSRPYTAVSFLFRFCVNFSRLIFDIWQIFMGLKINVISTSKNKCKN